MAIPDFQTLMLPVLRLSSKDQIKTATAIQILSDEFKLTDQERSVMLPSGKQSTIANRVHWAVTYLGKAGLIERIQRGTYVATEAGLKVLQDPPSKIDIKYLAKFPKFNEFRSAEQQREPSTSNPDTQIETGTPEEKIDEASAVLDAAVRTELLDKCRSLLPVAFEKLIVDLMLAMGYGVGGSGTHVGKTCDGGIDGTITEDALGLDVVYLQAKRYAEGNNIGVEKIREFSGTLDEKGATKGVFVTTSKFAQGAKQFTSRSTKRIELIDGERLASLMVRYGVGVRTYRKVEIKKIDTDYFDDLEG
jgi:restriction system protein